jgi:superfamily I DNA/RNA helicase
LDYLRRRTHARKSVKGITLSTIHQSKGLEYDTVYFVGLKQGILPHKDGEINEERRLWFVGCSRAARRLRISFYDIASEFLTNYKDRIVKYEEDGEPLLSTTEIGGGFVAAEMERRS